MSNKGDLLHPGQVIFEARKDKALPFGFFRGSISLPFFLWGVDSKVEDERREGALSIAEPPNLKEILTIHPITISNMLKIEALKKIMAYFWRKEVC